MQVVDHDRFVGEGLHRRRVRDLEDRPSARRLAVEVGHGRHLGERGVLRRGRLGLVGERRVVPDAHQLQVPHAEVEVGDRSVRQRAHGVRRRLREGRDHHEVVRRRRGRLEVEAFHGLDAAVRPVREEHQRERGAVRADRVAALPRHPTGRQRVGRVEERAVLGPRLGGEVGGGAALVPGVVVTGPVRQEITRLLHAHERDRRRDHREDRDRDHPHRVARQAALRRRRGCRRGRGPLAAADHPRRPQREQPRQLGHTQARQQEQHQVPERQHPQVPGRGLPEQLAQALPVVEDQPGHERDRGDDERRAAAVEDAGTDGEQRERVDEPVLRQEHPVEVVADRLVAHVGRVSEVDRQGHQPERGQQDADRADRRRPGEVRDGPPGEPDHHARRAPRRSPRPGDW